MEHAIIIRLEAKADLDGLGTFDRRIIMDAIQSNLRHEPAVLTRNRKKLEAGLEIGFEHEPPLLELRVGGFRVFYDVNQSTHSVYIRRVRAKGPNTRTQEIVR